MKLRKHLAHALQVTTLVMTIAGAITTIGLASEVDSERMQRLIEQLGDPSRAARVAAERELREMGPDVLPALPAPDEVSSRAVRDAVERLRTVLERQQAEQTAEASRVTLTGTHSLREMVKAVSEPTGNRISVDELSDETLEAKHDVDWQEATFWEAVQWIESHADVVSRLEDAGRALQLSPRSDEQSPASVTSVGAFRIFGQSFSCRPDFTNADREVVRVTFHVESEPRLRPLFVRVAHTDYRLLTNDLELKPLNVDAKLERPAASQSETSLTIDFVTDKPCEIESAMLHGKLDVELAAGEETFVFRNLDTSERVMRRRGSVVVTMDKTSFITNETSGTSSACVDLQVAYDSSGRAFESHRTWVYHNMASLRTRDESQHWIPTGFDTLAEAEAAVRLSYRFANFTSRPEELEIVYAAPTLVLTVPLEFELAQFRRKSDL
ncbi:MAG: hypothetical protein KDA93_07820 [Planctomycetaceae bacterium]|nr:hypothetical protein [Planctomycetaceae bacterium]